VNLARNAAGNSAWTVGYIPQLVTGVWMGYSNPAPASQSEAAQLLENAASGLWHAVMQYASRSFPIQSWVVPSGLSEIQVCDPSGMLPTADCPNVVTETFLAGSEPVQTDRMYQRMKINRETGNLATVYTPPELVEERVFFIVPPEGREWAQNAGVKIPPGDYDMIPMNVPPGEDESISSPKMFSYVHASVPIIGNAAGSGFSSYRIQVGQGLNPSTWLLISQDSSLPVRNNRLAIWDTSGLSGLYAVQLVVFEKDQSVHRATVLVTVDNTPPEVRILYPEQGEQVALSDNLTLVFQVQGRDDLGLQGLVFFVDGQELGRLTQAPFSFPWTAQPGEHTLLVQATDLAGNTAEASLNFTVK
jgi:hypothetical protein